MKMLNKLRALLSPDPAPLATKLLRNWKPKLICFILAVLVWLWVELRYVQDSDDWDIDSVRLSEP